MSISTEFYKRKVKNGMIELLERFMVDFPARLALFILAFLFGLFIVILILAYRNNYCFIRTSLHNAFGRNRVHVFE